MSTEVDQPWKITELTPDTKRQSLVDQIVIVFKTLWDNDTDNAHALAQSTNKEDSAEGSVRTDKTLLCAAVKKLAKAMVDQGDHRVEELAGLQVDDIKPKINAATKRVGVDRVAIAARKAEFLAIQGAEPANLVDDQPESSVNGRRDDPAPSE